MVLARVHGNFGRKDAQMLFQKKPLVVDVKNEAKDWDN
jgi:hypothetical protein